MFEVKGNLWTLPADVICITTNGFVKKNGDAVMGRGCALEAVEKFPMIQKQLGHKITTYGNHVHHLISSPSCDLLSFPVKHNWFDKADLDLIEQSCQEIVTWVYDQWDMTHSGKQPIRFIAIPRPGCGNGQLEWKDVKPICEEYLDDRFGIVTF